MSEYRNRKSWHIAVGCITLVHLVLSGTLSGGAILLSDRGPIAGLLRTPAKVINDINTKGRARETRRAEREQQRERQRFWFQVMSYSWLIAAPLALVGGIACLTCAKWSYPTLAGTYALWLTSSAGCWMFGGVPVIAILLTFIPLMLGAFLVAAMAETAHADRPPAQRERRPPRREPEDYEAREED